MRERPDAQEYTSAAQGHTPGSHSLDLAASVGRMLSRPELGIALLLAASAWLLVGTQIAQFAPRADRLAHHGFNFTAFADGFSSHRLLVGWPAVLFVLLAILHFAARRFLRTGGSVASVLPPDVVLLPLPAEPLRSSIISVTLEAASREVWRGSLLGSKRSGPISSNHRIERSCLTEVLLLALLAAVALGASLWGYLQPGQRLRIEVVESLAAEPVGAPRATLQPAHRQWESVGQVLPIACGRPTSSEQLRRCALRAGLAEGELEASGAYPEGLVGATAAWRVGGYTVSLERAEVDGASDGARVWIHEGEKIRSQPAQYGEIYDLKLSEASAPLRIVLEKGPEGALVALAESRGAEALPPNAQPSPPPSIFAGPAALGAVEPLGTAAQLQLRSEEPARLWLRAVSSSARPYAVAGFFFAFVALGAWFLVPHRRVDVLVDEASGAAALALSSRNRPRWAAGAVRGIQLAQSNEANIDSSSGSAGDQEIRR